MQTRKDHLQAYRFAMGRLATALVSGDPGRGESPTKRAALGTFLGAGLVVLLCIGFGVYGLISPPTNASWRSPGSILVEQDTGSRYLYLGGELRPVLNYASALLIEGKGATVRDVSAASLGRTPHGAPVGIPGAPDSLPANSALLSGAWTRCLRSDLPGGQVVDFAPAGLTSALPSGRQLLLGGPDGRRYLLWQGVSYPVPSDSTLIALGLDGDQPVPAPQSWLAALPTGVPLAAAPIAGSGHPAGQVAGRPVAVGQQFVTAEGGADHDYVMTSAGIAPVGATESALLAARPGASAIRRVDATALAAATVGDAGSPPGSSLPDVLDAPAFTAPGQVVCLRQSSDGAALTTAVVVERGQAATGGRSVLVPPTGGVLAVDQQQLAAQVSDPQTYLITDQGVAYALGDEQAAPTLGLSGAATVALPPAVLAALPQGPVLDSSAADATVKGG